MSRYLIGDGDRRKERANQQRLQSRIGNAHAGDIGGEIRRAMEDAARLYKADGSDVFIEEALQGHTDKLRESVSRLWYRGATMSGERILGAAKSIHGPRWELKQSGLERFQDAIQYFIETEALQRVTRLAATTIEDVRSTIAQGKAAGDAVDDVANMISAKAQGVSMYRGMMIARTETHAAYNYGHQVGAEESQLDLGKEWVAASDERTRRGKTSRFDHLGADGETVGLKDEFTETGEALRYPGDPWGSGGNIIHCRCARADVLL